MCMCFSELHTKAMQEALGRFDYAALFHQLEEEEERIRCELVRQQSAAVAGCLCEWDERTIRTAIQKRYDSTACEIVAEETVKREATLRAQLCEKEDTERLRVGLDKVIQLEAADRAALEAMAIEAIAFVSSGIAYRRSIDAHQVAALVSRNQQLEDDLSSSNAKLKKLEELFQPLLDRGFGASHSSIPESVRFNVQKGLVSLLPVLNCPVLLKAGQLPSLTSSMEEVSWFCHVSKTTGLHRDERDRFQEMLKRVEQDCCCGLSPNCKAVRQRATIGAHVMRLDGCAGLLPACGSCNNHHNAEKMGWFQNSAKYFAELGPRRCHRDTKGTYRYEANFQKVYDVSLHAQDQPASHFADAAPRRHVPQFAPHAVPRAAVQDSPPGVPCGADSSGRPLYRGPRGGVFYVAAGGYKKYVKHECTAHDPRTSV